MKLITSTRRPKSSITRSPRQGSLGMWGSGCQRVPKRNTGVLQIAS